MSSFNNSRRLDQTWVSAVNGNNGGNHIDDVLTREDEFPLGQILIAVVKEEEDQEEEDLVDLEYEHDKSESNTSTIFEEENETFESTRFHGSEFYVTEISAPSLPIGRGIPTIDDFGAILKTQAGFVGNQIDIDEDLNILNPYQFFESVGVDLCPSFAKGKTNAVKVVFNFVALEYPPLETFEIRGATVIPHVIKEKVMSEYLSQGGGKVDTSTLYGMKNIIESFYQDRGLYCDIRFEELQGGNVIAEVSEFRVGSVRIIPIDDLGNATEKSALDLRVVEQKVRDVIIEGELFSVRDARKAQCAALNTKLIEQCGFISQPDYSQSLIDIEVLVKERPAKIAEIETEWQIQPGNLGRQSISTLIPSGNLQYENLNLGGKGAQLAVAIATQDLFRIGEGSECKIDLKVPNCMGPEDPKRTVFEFAALETLEVSPILTSNNPPRGGLEAKIMVHRIGTKLSLNQTLPFKTKGSIVLATESISYRDEFGAPVTAPPPYQQGLTSTGHPQPAPPITLSGSESDMIVTLKNCLVQDSTIYKDHVISGNRDILTIDQGFGISSTFPSFGRYTLSMTRIIPLNILQTWGKSPMTFVLHGKFGNCVGDVALYDCFTIGGPFSCRGYKVGELGFARKFLETAVEVRYPLTKLRGGLYAFVEHANSLESSAKLPGNPNEFYRISGKGTSLGYGIKFAAARLEYARESNSGTGSFSIHFGERF